MSYFLVEHPNSVCPQWRTPRRAPLSGTVGVHTCEGVMDDVGLDTGAENVASYISTRADYGSYHVIVDSDSTVDCVPDDYEAWHIAEPDAYGAGMNSHSWGVSAACRTVDWNPDDPWTQATILLMGQAIAAFWTRNGFDPLDPAICRFLTRDEAKRRTPGLVLHGVVQPGDRSDAWRDHPRRPELEAMLLDAIRGTTPTPIPPEDDMPYTPQQLTQYATDGTIIAGNFIARDPRDGGVFIFTKLSMDRRHVPSESAAMKARTQLGIPFLRGDDPTASQDLDPEVVDLFARNQDDGAPVSLSADGMTALVQSVVDGFADALS